MCFSASIIHDKKGKHKVPTIPMDNDAREMAEIAADRRRILKFFPHGGITDWNRRINRILTLNSNVYVVCGNMDDDALETDMELFQEAPGKKFEGIVPERWWWKAVTGHCISFGITKSAWIGL